MTNDIDSILNGIKPSIVTPHLADISNLSSEQKLRKIATLIVKNMVSEFNKSDKAKIPRAITHEGQVIEVRYLDIDSLYLGVWPAVSLMMLQLSIGEQNIIIESLYPKNTQLAAKKFAITFTNHLKTGSNVEIKTDKDITDKLDNANAGIAMLLAQMAEGGYPKPHPDKIKKQQLLINELVNDTRRARAHKNALNKAKEHAKWQDKERRK